MIDTLAIVEILDGLHGNPNFQRIFSIIERLVREEKKQKNDTTARILREALERLELSRKIKDQELSQLPSDIKGILESKPLEKDFADISLRQEIDSALQCFILELRESDRLHAAGLKTNNSILMAGPPGNGKTTAVSILAKTLELPLYIVKMSTVVDSHLGETSRNINSIFDFAKNKQCVLFLDELDCIGTIRGGGSQSVDRERDNITIALLLNMDAMDDDCIIIGATNRDDNLDPAIVRRFKLRLWFDSPNQQEIINYIVSYKERNDVDFDFNIEDLEGSSYSRVEEFCQNQHKKIVLGLKSWSMNSDWIGKNKEE